MTTDVDLTKYDLQLVGDVTVCFSGGLDSSTVAYLAGLQHAGRVHLYTLDHGYGYPFNRWARRPARDLARALGEDRVVHHYGRTRELFDRVAMRSLLADRRRYGQGFGCCLGCTMAMISNIIIYNLERGIPHVMMGSSVGGTYAVMSMPVTVEKQKQYLARYGILYSPLLLEGDIHKDEERKLLDGAGVFRGLRFLDKHSFGNQGYCLLSLQHMADVLFNVHPTYDPQNVQRFFEDKLPICERYIAEHFSRTGQDLEAAVERLRELTGTDPEGGEQPSPGEPVEHTGEGAADHKQQAAR